METVLQPILELKGVTVRFGGLTALDNVSLNVGSGELVGLIGPNGAGKTTVFNVVTGINRPDDGEVLFDGRTINQLPPHRRSAAGIARTFQNIRLFSDVSVLNNVKIGADLHTKAGLYAAVARTERLRQKEQDVEGHAMGFLKIMGLERFRNDTARNLPYGEQRRLEIARALATRPKLLLLDEPAAGMHPQETQKLMDLIKWLRESFRLTILLIEHDMRVVMGVCERIYVLDYGEVIAEGHPEAIQNDPRVIEAYLGEPDAHS